VVEPVERDTRGLVRPDVGLRRFTLVRHEPRAELRRFVDRLWEVSWDLPTGERHEQQVLVHPAVNVVLGDGPATVSGVQTRTFTRVLSGRGRVLGVLFRPAGFRAFLDAPMSSITDRELSAGELLGEPVPEATPEAVEAWLAPLVPAGPHPCEGTTQLVETVARDRSIRRVDELAALAGITVRALQRRFADHVGIGPKWVIRRYRLYEAMELATRADGPRWAQLAADLGYADQAHLARDFAAAVGTPPAAYARAAHQ